MCRQGNSQPISEGIDFFFFLIPPPPPKGRLCSFFFAEGGESVERKNTLLFKYILFICLSAEMFSLYFEEKDR